jgi:AraC-like DNA-binding protein
MRLQHTRSAGEGLERSCERTGGSWIAASEPTGGVELFAAWFAGEAYHTHRHDTYAICVTTGGVQVFDYRGAVRTSTAGQVVALYPDEAHDGRAGTDDGFGYRIVYVDPARLALAVRAIVGRPAPLPFVREPVSINATLARAVDRAFDGPLDPLAVDELIAALAQGLLEGDHGALPSAVPSRVDATAVERAREFLDAEKTRIVRSSELEAITGLTRYELARQFRIALGTSPHRYLLMRRLQFARAELHRERPLVEIACDAGFADQAHFTRAFRSGFGLTPGRYRALLSSRPRGRLASRVRGAATSAESDRGAWPRVPAAVDVAHRRRPSLDA